MQFLEAKGEVLQLAHMELTLHVYEGGDQRCSPAEDIIHNDVDVCAFVDDDVMLAGKVFPGTVHIVDEGDKLRRAIDWSKRHAVVGSLGGIWPRKKQASPASHAQCQSNDNLAVGPTSGLPCKREMMQ